MVTDTGLYRHVGGVCRYITHLISSSRRALNFAQKVVDALSVNNLDTWVGWKNTPKAKIGNRRFTVVLKKRMRSYTYNELMARDKVNLDIFWLRDESLEDSANLPNPDVLALEIVEDLKAALSQFESIEEELSAED
jgi:hypothetical protein